MPLETPTAAHMRDRYLAAELSLLDGKEVRFGDRTLRLEDLAEIRKGRQEWEARAALDAVGNSCCGADVGVLLADFRGGR